MSKDAKAEFSAVKRLLIEPKHLRMTRQSTELVAIFLLDQIIAQASTVALTRMKRKAVEFIRRQEG